MDESRADGMQGEFHIPTEYVRDLYERLLAAGAAHGIRDVGYRAVNSLRLEKQDLVWATDAEVIMHGGENLTHPTVALAANVRSVGFGYTIGRTVFSAYVPASLSRDTDFIVDVATDRHPATRHDGPFYDPEGSRIRQ